MPAFWQARRKVFSCRWGEQAATTTRVRSLLLDVLLDHRLAERGAHELVVPRDGHVREVLAGPAGDFLDVDRAGDIAAAVTHVNADFLGHVGYSSAIVAVTRRVPSVVYGTRRVPTTLIGLRSSRRHCPVELGLDHRHGRHQLLAEAQLRRLDAEGHAQHLREENDRQLEVGPRRSRSPAPGRRRGSTGTSGTCRGSCRPRSPPRFAAAGGSARRPAAR